VYSVVKRVRRKAPPLVPAPESVFQRQVISLARLLGWAVFFTLRSKGSPPGWPDLVLIKPPHILFRELKSDSGRLNTYQLNTLAMLAQCDMDAAVWRPRDWARIERELRA